MTALSPILAAAHHGTPRLRGYDAIAATVDRARLHNDLRTAEREWQGFAMFDAWPGQPWAEHRDAAAARIVALRAQIAREQS